MDLAGKHLHRYKDIEVPPSIRMQKCHHLVAAFPLTTNLLRIGHLLVLFKINRMVILVEEHPHGPFVHGGIRNKEVRGVPDKETLFVKNTVLTKDSHHVPIEPLHEG